VSSLKDKDQYQDGDLADVDKDKDFYVRRTVYNANKSTVLPT